MRSGLDGGHYLPAFDNRVVFSPIGKRHAAAPTQYCSRRPADSIRSTRSELSHLSLFLGRDTPYAHTPRHHVPDVSNTEAARPISVFAKDDPESVALLRGRQKYSSSLPRRG